jgi:GPH family glycoside/pentoside/hexuronide:cation symporter
MGTRLRYALLGFPLAFVGLPLYLYVPKFYAETFAIDIAVLGGILLALRVMDMLVDPVIGYVGDRLAPRRRLMMLAGGAAAAGAYAALFIPQQVVAPNTVFTFATAILYLGYSAVVINYYAWGLGLAHDEAESTRVSTARETAVLIGTLAAALLPAILQPTMGMQGALQLSSIVFAITMLVGFLALPHQTYRPAPPAARPSFWIELRQNRQLQWLFPLFFINALPVAITSTLFLFYADDVLGREADAGYFLVVYFLAAAVGTGMWSALARRFGKRRALMTGMVLALSSFAGCIALNQGNADWFYLICALSGVALGADMILLPALLADALRQKDEHGSFSFALWQALSKWSLALAAGLALPLLALGGYQPGGNLVTADNVILLVIGYAVVPCVLKLVALAVLVASPIQRTEEREGRLA